MTCVVTALDVPADGYIVGPRDGPGNALGDGGGRLFEWYSDGDTPSAYYPQFRVSPQTAAVFDAVAAREAIVDAPG
ncbi:MAG TPA: hypothetical protein VHV75_03695 [Solirubrobacteraceae bacterium]|jgi:hypothetical protein|nr:hypothetical protein [Solirubrobacteraceae bacterium]